MNNLLVTGSSGLVGSEVVSHFAPAGWRVFGVDSNQRADFFGPDGDTRWNQKRLAETYPAFNPVESDIHNRDGVLKLMADLTPDLIVHAAAQPSHDLAASRPFDDFDVNAVGTLNLLEATRRHASDAVFVHMSTKQGVRGPAEHDPTEGTPDPVRLRGPDHATITSSLLRQLRPPVRDVLPVSQPCDRVDPARSSSDGVCERRQLSIPVSPGSA